MKTPGFLTWPGQVSLGVSVTCQAEPPDPPAQPKGRLGWGQGLQSAANGLTTTSPDPTSRHPHQDELVVGQLPGPVGLGAIAFQKRLCAVDLILILPSG